MVRFFLAAVGCAALAGCVRDESDEARNDATRRNTVETASRAADARDSTTRTGSRLLPAPDTLTDPVITGKVKAEILADPSLRGADISVNTTGGVVNLTGLVASQEQAALASAHAQRQDGVMRVDNHLAVDLH